MVVLDRRDEFEDSDSNLDTVAAEAHRLRESEQFHEDLADVLTPVFNRYLDCEAVDTEAEAVLREWVVDEGMGALFQLRNQIVSNREADLEEGDIVRMKSAHDEQIVVPQVVRASAPGETGVRTWRVDPESGDIRGSDLSAGRVRYVDLFEVDRSERGRNPFSVAQEVAWEVSDDV